MNYIKETDTVTTSANATSNRLVLHVVLLLIILAYMMQQLDARLDATQRSTDLQRNLWYRGDVGQLRAANILAVCWHIGMTSLTDHDK